MGADKLVVGLDSRAVFFPKERTNKHHSEKGKVAKVAYIYSQLHF